MNALNQNLIRKPLSVLLAITPQELSNGFPSWDFVTVLKEQEFRKAVKRLKRDERKRRSKQKRGEWSKGCRVDVHGNHRIIVRLTMLIPLEVYN